MLKANGLVLATMSRGLINRMPTTARAFGKRDDLKPVNSKFVPKSKPVSEEDLARVREFVLRSKNLFVVTGAGISTESGIPDYRSENVGLYARSTSRPIEHGEFMKHAHKRKSYWARNYVSWPIFSSFSPNRCHYTLADWERRGKVHYHVTQNVDSLLVKAGARKLTELHGTSYKVKCMDCDARFTREAVQLIIQSQNRSWGTVSDFELSADNDVLLTEDQIKDFHTPVCPICSKDRLKPEVGKCRCFVIL
jgi:NAD-dependent deacetylase sirtuin 4